jgi:hypothetical protein
MPAFPGLTCAIALLAILCAPPREASGQRKDPSRDRNTQAPDRRTASNVQLLNRKTTNPQGCPREDCMLTSLHDFGDDEFGLRFAPIAQRAGMKLRASLCPCDTGSTARGCRIDQPWFDTGPAQGSALVKANDSSGLIAFLRRHEERVWRIQWEAITAQGGATHTSWNVLITKSPRGGPDFRSDVVVRCDARGGRP